MNHVYTLIRNPKEHVLSQYFHCTESKEHRKKELMPSLDEWLKYWVDHIPENENSRFDSNKYSQKDSLFQCYKPTNLQSTYVDFNVNDKAPAEIKADLHSRFAMIGLTEYFDQSICIFTALLTDGNIPDGCDCTGKDQQQQRRRLKERQDHNVIHHGNSFNATESQIEAINALTAVDQLLYYYAQEIFWEQVKLTEEKYNFELCLP
jgi:hypothetical protein